MHLPARKPSLSVAGIHGSQDVKTETVPISISAHAKGLPLTTVQFCNFMLKRISLGDKIVNMQLLKDRYTYLRNLPNQSYNHNQIHIIRGQDSYGIYDS